MDPNKFKGEEEFFALATHPFKFRLFLLQKLPAAWFSGVRIKNLDPVQAEVIISYKWFTRNPFRSTYFACLSMAAEMSTGVLAMARIYKRKPRVSMLVVSIEGRFYKKAVSITRFICKDGMAIKQTIETAISTGQSQTIRALSSGFNEKDELVAEFWVEWSFKGNVIM